MKIFALALSAALVSQVSAATIYFENFETGLDGWVGKSGGAHSGEVVVDPIQADNAIRFNALNGAGDIFSPALTSSTGQYILSWDYLGVPGQGGVSGDLGGFIGYSNGLPDSHFWLAGTQNGYGPVHLVDDGQWHHYSIAFNAGSNIHIMLEDYNFSGGVPRDAYFDNIMVTDQFGATPAAVPEPSTFAFFGLGLLGLAAWRRKASRR